MNLPADDLKALYDNPAVLLQKLIRFDTTNPPGNELECVKYVRDLLNSSGIDSLLLGEIHERPNLVARVKGRGNSPPLLLYGHADVVTAEGQDWKYPPFEGIIAEQCVWGRGALDMKGGVAMMVSALLRLKSEGTVPPGDVIFALVSDEEAGEHGAKFLVDKHSELFSGVKYAIGELGGFTMHIGNKKFYPIMVSEKQQCTLKATFRGKPGHGSMVVRGNAMEKAGKFLTAINAKKLPVHVTPPAKLMFKAIAEKLPYVQRIFISLLLCSRLTDLVLLLMGTKGDAFSPLLHNTVNATILRGGNTTNVVPAEVEAILDGRLLPGYKPEDIVGELRALAGTDTGIEVIKFIPGPGMPDMGLFDTLAGIIKEMEPDGIPVPLITPGITDARYFSRIGIQTYGYLPMILPKGVNYTELIHGANERIPLKALEFGTNAIYNLLQRF